MLRSKEKNKDLEGERNFWGGTVTITYRVTRKASLRKYNLR